jgi:hypothetical protein
MITVDAVLFVSSSLFWLWDIVNPCGIYTMPYVVRGATNTARYSEHIFADIHDEKQEPTYINVLQLRNLTNFLKFLRNRRTKFILF